VVAVVAGALLTPQVIAHLVFPLTTRFYFESMYASMGGSLPPATALLMAIGPWFGALLAAIDILLFWYFLWLARRYWIGLLFAPLFAAGTLGGLVIWALYAPVFNVIGGLIK